MTSLLWLAPTRSLPGARLPQVCNSTPVLLQANRAHSDGLATPALAYQHQGTFHLLFQILKNQNHRINFPSEFRFGPKKKQNKRKQNNSHRRSWGCQSSPFLAPDRERCRDPRNSETSRGLPLYWKEACDLDGGLSYCLTI